MSRHVVRTGMPGQLSLPWQFVGTLSPRLRRGGLADQDAQRTAVGINLNAAHRQSGVEDAPHQAGGLAALERVTPRGRRLGGCGDFEA